MVFSNYWKSIGCFDKKKLLIFDKKNELADKNQRLQEKSAMAVQQLQKFTEGFLQIIEKA